MQPLLARKLTIWVVVATVSLLCAVYLISVVSLRFSEQSGFNKRKLSNIDAAREALSMLRLIADDSGYLPETIADAAALIGVEKEPMYLTKDRAYVAFEYFPGHSISDSPETVILKSPIPEVDGTILFGQLDGLVDFRIPQGTAEKERR